MLYIQSSHDPWRSQRDLPNYWSPQATTQTSSSERSTLGPFTLGGALSPSPTTPQDDMDMDTDSPRASPVSYQQQRRRQQQQQQLLSPESTPQSTPQQPSQSLPTGTGTPEDMPVRASFHQPPIPPQAPPGAYRGLDAGKVAAALEVARDSPDGAQDPEVSGILELALSQIWNRVLAQPDRYVMTKGEFAVFNLYQHMFLGNQLATAARRRFWDHTRG